MKRSYIDGAPLGHWTEIITVARGYGYTGQALSSDATWYLTEQGHTVEEKDVAAPKFKINDTSAWCPQHPTVRYDSTRYDQCLSCEKQSKRGEGARNRRARVIPRTASPDLPHDHRLGRCASSA